jgi:hypothetical protein
MEDKPLVRKYKHKAWSEGQGECVPEKSKKQPVFGRERLFQTKNLLTASEGFFKIRELVIIITIFKRLLKGAVGVIV